MHLESISSPPQNGGQPSHLLVLLHGWGANAEDLFAFSSLFNLPGYQLIFPNAPFNHPYVSGGRAWYSLETGKYEGANESKQLLSDWLLSLEKTTGVPLKDTVLAGFSQGGAMTLDVGLKLPLAGLCCLSGYLQFEPTFSEGRKPPVLIVHGRQDQVVPITAARKANQELSKIGVKVEYQEFDMGHEVIKEVINLMQQFILANESG